MPKKSQHSQKKQLRGKANYKQGHITELLTRLYLWCKLYSIIETRYKTPMGEIDLLCIKNQHLIIVEVKSGRGILTTHNHPITQNQQRRLKNAGNYLYAHWAEKYNLKGLRFDLVCLDILSWRLQHFRNITL